jgi:ferredoxin
MKIVVVRDRCEGNARCVALAPAVFRVDESDQVEVLVAEPGEDQRAAVTAAAARCPRQALIIED